MNKKEMSKLNNNKVIKYSQDLIKRIKSCKELLNEKLHCDVINFCTVVLSDNPIIYKKINKDFPDIPKPVEIVFVNYTKNGPKKEKSKFQIPNQLEEIANQEKIYKLRQKLENK